MYFNLFHPSEVDIFTSTLQVKQAQCVGALRGDECVKREHKRKGRGTG